MSSTKITLKVEERILRSFNEMLEQCHMKRDGFLHHAIKTEIPFLEEDLKGLCLSHDARQYISAQLRKMKLVTINVVVDKDTANKLRHVMKAHNIIRDAFINRLILFLICPESLQEELELQRVLRNEMERETPSGRTIYELPSVSISPLEAIKDTVSDPLHYIREFFSAQERDPIYRTMIHQNLIGFSCYLPDEDIPGTAENAIMQRRGTRLLKTLFESKE